MNGDSQFSLRLLASISIILMLPVSSGCQTVPAHIAAPLPLPRTDGRPSNAEKGREIYVSIAKCAMCHRPKPVYDYSPESWSNDILPRMAKKSRLSEDEYNAVLEYVTSTASVPPVK